MSVASKLYEQIADAGDDEARFRAIANAIDALEQSLPGRDTLATKGDLRETELRLEKEIKSVELRLTKETEQIRLEIHAAEARNLKAQHRQTLWLVTAVGAIIGLVRLLDLLFA